MRAMKENKHINCLDVRGELMRLAVLPFGIFGIEFETVSNAGRNSTKNTPEPKNSFFWLLSTVSTKKKAPKDSFEKTCFCYLLF